jgi:uncharacterized SAM-binding protein YcdF (DUF218 family)
VSRRYRLLLKAILLCALIWPVVAWIAADLLITESPLDTADCIVVLAGSASYKERTLEAARLLHQGRSNLILITNDNMRGPWSSSELRNPFFYELSLAELEKAGVAAQNVKVLKRAVSSTQEESEVVKEYAAEHGLRSILVVTSPYHSRRALWVFNNAFAGTGVRVGVAGISQGSNAPSPATWWLTIRGWQLVPSEYGKMVLYLIKSMTFR